MISKGQAINYVEAAFRRHLQDASAALKEQEEKQA
jgi:hypothetical protein